MIITAFMALVGRLHDVRREEGQGLIEYALILALVAAVAVGTLLLIGGEINTVFQNVLDLFGGEGEVVE